jgi:hypothetical protein
MPALVDNVGANDTECRLASAVYVHGIPKTNCPRKLCTPIFPCILAASNAARSKYQRAPRSARRSAQRGSKRTTRHASCSNSVGPCTGCSGVVEAKATPTASLGLRASPVDQPTVQRHRRHVEHLGRHQDPCVSSRLQAAIQMRHERHGHRIDRNGGVTHLPQPLAQRCPATLAAALMEDGMARGEGAERAVACQEASSSGPGPEVGRTPPR